MHTHANKAQIPRETQQRHTGLQTCMTIRDTHSDTLSNRHTGSAPAHTHTHTSMELPSYTQIHTSLPPGDLGWRGGALPELTGAGSDSARARAAAPAAGDVERPRGAAEGRAGGHSSRGAAAPERPRSCSPRQAQAPPQQVGWTPPRDPAQDRERMRWSPSP